MSPMNTAEARYLGDAIEEIEPVIKAEAAPIAEKAISEFSHWIHLADGRVMQTVGTMSHWFDSNDPKDKGVPVIGSYLNPSYVPPKPTDA